MSGNHCHDGEWRSRQNIRMKIKIYGNVVSEKDLLCFLHQIHLQTTKHQIIELDDLKNFTGNPDQFDGKNPWVSGVDFPNKTNPLTQKFQELLPLPAPPEPPELLRRNPLELGKRRRILDLRSSQGHSEGFFWNPKFEKSLGDAESHLGMAWSLVDILLS